MRCRAEPRLQRRRTIGLPLLPVEELSVLCERHCMRVRSGFRFGVYGLAGLGVAALWVYALQAVLPAPKVLLPRVPGALSGSTEVIPAIRRAGHSSVTAKTVRQGSAAPSERAAVGLTTLPTGRTHGSAVSAKTSKPKRPRPGTPAPGGTTPPTKPGGTSPPTSPGGTTPPTSAPGPVAAPPVQTPPSPPSGGDTGGGGSGSSGSKGTPVAAPSDGGRTTAGVPPVQCPGLNGAVTNASVVVSNGVATATFQIAAGCSGIAVSLGTDQTSTSTPSLFKTVSDSFGAGGPYTLSAAVPACQFEADLTAGTVTLASASGGTSCAPSPPPPPPAPSPPPTPQPPPFDHGNGQGDHPGDHGQGSSGGNDRSGSADGDGHHDHGGSSAGSGHRGCP
jgi:hypothetical protein